ncbi:hypothetical protein MES5069_430015 [Mesorhizobium escarrei]|uniref:Transposase n=1 Tax=Mesorhizobium escarrei TaxID=666018 RepID=A0ABM9E645_9HYPH|nr:hypothetical protein MES5069_430015 [Mesorhizobium escarrei]
MGSWLEKGSVAIWRTRRLSISPCDLKEVCGRHHKWQAKVALVGLLSLKETHSRLVSPN